MPPSVDQLLRKAKRHADQGENELAAQHYKKVLDKFPQNQKARAGLEALQQPNDNLANDLMQLLRQGRLQEVVTHGEALLQQFPNSPLIPSLMAEAHLGLGAPERAAACFARAVEVEPGNAQSHNNLGIVLQRIGRHGDAVGCFQKAVELKPGYTDAVANLGNGLKDMGDFSGAITCYEKVLKKNPGDAAILNNLGTAYNELGQAAEAAECFTRSLQQNPADGQTHNNLAVALHRQGKLNEAISHFRKSVERSPQNAEYWQSYGELLCDYTAREFDQQLADDYLSVLDKKTIVRPAHAARSITALLKKHPGMQQILQQAGQELEQASLAGICTQLANMPLFLRLIELAPVFDLDVENLLRTLRRMLLRQINGHTADQTQLLFQAALALQCFTNEYLYGEDEEETAALSEMEKTIEKQIEAGDNPAPSLLACLAAYRPLHNYSWADTISPVAELEGLFQRQLKDHIQERDTRSTIKSLGEIADKVSTEVRAQYEENPYPRWVNTALSHKPVQLSTLARSLHLKLAAGSVFPLQPVILIAGCGTGQQALVAASRFANCQVTAVDLSLSSLSYAIRKTGEFGLTNIEYLQADILGLSALEQQFDLIESVGVLHHMAEPMAGWKVLADRLKQGGLMKIGLYSELARKSIVEARDEIAASGVSSSTADMLKFRAELLASTDSSSKQLRDLTNFSDFYSTSELRDLLFHVSEHRFTLPQIKQCLAELKLEFAGFEFWNKDILQKFLQNNPDPESLYCLDTWHEFELANPDTFRGMYQFWLQK